MLVIDAGDRSPRRGSAAAVASSGAAPEGVEHRRCSPPVRRRWSGSGSPGSRIGARRRGCPPAPRSCFSATSVSGSISRPGATSMTCAAMFVRGKPAPDPGSQVAQRLRLQLIEEDEGAKLRHQRRNQPRSSSSTMRRISSRRPPNVGPVRRRGRCPAGVRGRAARSTGAGCAKSRTPIGRRSCRTPLASRDEVLRPDVLAERGAAEEARCRWSWSGPRLVPKPALPVLQGALTTTRSTCTAAANAMTWRVADSGSRPNGRRRRSAASPRAASIPRRVVGDTRRGRARGHSFSRASGSSPAPIRSIGVTSTRACRRERDPRIPASAGRPCRAPRY